MKKVLINASNLHVGGGVQVAVSFILELAGMTGRLPSCEVYVYASSEVNANLLATGFSANDFRGYEIFDIHGLNALNKENMIRFSGFDLIFTIFGPLYTSRGLPNHIVGFAQAWIIYPNNEVNRLLSLKQSVLMRFKFLVQWFFFRRYSRLIVELPHVKNGLIKRKSFPPERIDVVNNCFSSIYLDSSRWAPVIGLNIENENVIKIGYITRDYPHKNLDLLVDVAKLLHRISSKKFEFFVTLSEAEWTHRNEEFRDFIVNIGALSVAQCPTFYQAMDGVIFSSLLESFSVTPLEAMVMKRPLFASDRGFVRDCCGDHAIYFNPLDADSAAVCIDEWFCGTSDEIRNARVARAYQHVIGLPGSKERATSYIEIIEKQLAL